MFSFTEWVEFSPYEIGMAKYGTFMKTEHFGSKFFCGKLVNSYPEPTLAYLQGIKITSLCWETNRRLKIMQIDVLFHKGVGGEGKENKSEKGRKLGVK